MAIRYLKHGKPEADRAEDDTKVRGIVENTLADIGKRGDTAVRELSEKFDGYSPASFRLSEGEIEALMNRVSEREMADIKFAQEQVRNFAQVQRDSMLDVEVETMPGVILGHKNIPVQSVGCLRSGWQVPHGCKRSPRVCTASVAGVPRIIACTPPFRGTQPGRDRGDEVGWRP